MHFWVVRLLDLERQLLGDTAMAAPCDLSPGLYHSGSGDQGPVSPLSDCSLSHLGTVWIGPSADGWKLGGAGERRNRTSRRQCYLPAAGFEDR